MLFATPFLSSPFLFRYFDFFAFFCSFCFFGVRLKKFEKRDDFDFGVSFNFTISFRSFDLAAGRGLLSDILLGAELSVVSKHFPGPVAKSISESSFSVFWFLTFFIFLPEENGHIVAVFFKWDEVFLKAYSSWFILFPFFCPFYFLDLLFLLLYYFTAIGPFLLSICRKGTFTNLYKL